MSRTRPVLFALLLALAAAAAGVLALGARRPPAAEARAREFQRLVGGLGFGPARDLEPCAAAFDPRLCPACPNDYSPIPGGVFFCPEHAGSVFDYAPLPGEADRRPASDAHLP